MMGYQFSFLQEGFHSNKQVAYKVDKNKSSEYKNLVYRYAVKKKDQPTEMKHFS